MKTKPKTFDAVAASRQWRQDAGRRLDAMPLAERVAFLEGLRACGTGGQPASPHSALREQETPYGSSGQEAAP